MSFKNTFSPCPGFKNGTRLHAMQLLLVMLLMNFFYAGTPTFMKLASAELHPFQIVFLRHTLALLAFLPFFLMSPQKKIARADFFKIMLGAFLSFTFASMFQIVGMQLTKAADGSFIMAMEPIIVIVLAVIFLKEAFDPKMYGGLVLALIGFVALSAHSLYAGNLFDTRWTGNLLFLMAVMAEGSFPILLKPLLKKYSPLVIAFYCLLCASLYMLPFQGPELFYKLPQLQAATWGAVAYLGLGCSFLACFLWLRCLAQATATLVAVSWFIQPLFGCLFASILLSEPMTSNIGIGGCFILAGLGMLMPRTKPAPAAHPLQEPVMIHTPLPSPSPPKIFPRREIPAGILADYHRQQHRQKHIVH